MEPFFVGVVGFISCFLIFIVKVAKKKPKKIPLIFMAVFFVITIGGMIYAMNTPAVEVIQGNYNDIMSGKLNGEIVEIKGDILDIQNLGEGLYFVHMKTSDGEYALYTTDEVAGSFPSVGDHLVRVYITPGYTESEELILTIIAFLE